jgi:hypothetical protein
LDEKIENAEIKLKSPFGKKVENFFYHYKWHTIVALFLIFTIVICSFQMCSKIEYDVHIMYAGGREIKKSAADGDISEYQKLNSSILQYTPDFNEDGTSTANLLTLFVPSAAELEAMLGTDGRLEANTALIRDNTDMLEQNLLYGEYIICLLSEDLFLDFCKRDLPLFARINQYTNGNDADYEYINEYGIKLSSTQLYSKAGMQLLPENTVICIRNFSEVSSRFNKTQNEENYRRSTELLRSMLKNG